MCNIVSIDADCTEWFACARQCSHVLSPLLAGSKMTRWLLSLSPNISCETRVACRQRFKTVSSLAHEGGGAVEMEGGWATKPANSFELGGSKLSVGQNDFSTSISVSVVLSCYRGITPS